MPVIQTGQTDELLHVSRLLRQYVDRTLGSNQSGLFLTAAQALESRACRLSRLQDGAGKNVVWSAERRAAD